MFTNSKMLWMVTYGLKIWLSVNLEEFNRWLPIPNWIGKNNEFDIVLHWKICFIIWLVLTAITKYIFSFFGIFTCQSLALLLKYTSVNTTYSVILFRHLFLSINYVSRYNNYFILTAEIFFLVNIKDIKAYTDGFSIQIDIIIVQFTVVFEVLP